MMEEAKNVKVTYICCSNNPQQLQSMLLPSLQLVKSAYGENVNWLIIDTNQKKYPSAAAAYNHELEENKQVLGDILIFCHNDIAFENTDFHDFVVKTLLRDSNQIIGVAGKDEHNKVPSNLRYFANKEYITRTRIEKPMEVCSVDECCFAMTKELYTKIKFDEATCYHWHLYAVDFCYAASLYRNTKVIVSDVSIFHKMSGDSGLYTDSKFLKTMWRMVRKYHHQVKVIYTPCYLCHTNYLQALLEIGKTTLENLIKK